ncbi:hypothetical protein CHS0354_039156 [Potamilus streckersoni]|uniref:Uncharacterized protein n=1 Tax=Potamilus streckersoni TaxID=2493646 RepID=A0AAE0S784_9BIVA|nr:hypothetical protein CHS0354_039156 [Potamilus streckersoni]
MSSQSVSGGGRYTGTGDKPDLDNHANQCNPNNSEYKGHTPSYTVKKSYQMFWITKPDCGHVLQNVLK